MDQKRDTEIKITENFIDINRVFKDKAPRLYPFVPGFFMRYLKRVVHQQEVNKIIYENRDKWGLDFVQRLLEIFEVKINTEGLENIKPEDRCLIASNHPLGGMDGISLIYAVSKVRKDIVFPVNDILMNIPALKELFIPVNKHGSNAENIRLFNKTFESDILILYFPAGLVSRKQKGIIKDVEWKKTFLTKAKRYKRDIIPAHINGKNSNFFYNLANRRKKIGIKANLEMLYLVDEAFKLKDKDLRIIFGERIPYTYFDKRHKDIEWAGYLREYVYALGSGEPGNFQTWYEDNKK